MEHWNSESSDTIYSLDFWQCNHRCLICMSGSYIDRDPPVQMSRDEALEQIRSASAAGFQAIEFYGGEPTTAPFLPECLALAGTLGLKVFLYTNAYKLASETYAREIFSHKIDWVRTSLHSHEPRVHDFLTRVKGSHARVIQGIEHIRTYFAGGPFVVNIVMTSLNYQSLNAMIDLLHQLGIRGVKFSCVRPIGRAQAYPSLIPDWRRVGPHLIRAAGLCAAYGMMFDIGVFSSKILPGDILTELQTLPGASVRLG